MGKGNKTKRKKKQNVGKGIGELDAFDKQLCYDLLAEPRLSCEKLGDIYGASRQAVQKRLNKPAVQKYQDKLLKSKFAQVQACQTVAMRNAAGYLKRPNTEEGIKTTHLFIKPLVEHPQSMPTETVDPPTFHDVGS